MGNKKDRIGLIALILLFVMCLYGCTDPASDVVRSTEGEELPEVKLVIWCEERNIEILQEALEDFVSLHDDEARITFTFEAESEVNCREIVLSNLETAADIYFFADDQLGDLYNGGALMEITDHPEEVIESVGGENSGAALACMREGGLYAYPLAAGNGYFLYYRPSYFRKGETATLDGILTAVERNKKLFAMDFSSGWYLYSFFKGAGLDLSYDSVTGKSVCEWNSDDGQYKGTDVLKALLKIAGRKGFASMQDNDFIEGAQNGSVVAGVNGPWNLDILKSAWGDDLDAIKLPTFTLMGDQVQMCSFTGYKLVGINPKTENPDWCMKAAAYITGKDVQLKRFYAIGETPANLEAQSNPDVIASPVTKALSQQSRFGYTQNVNDSFWNASQLLGTVIAAGNPDHSDLQALLDRMVEETERTIP